MIHPDIVEFWDKRGYSVVEYHYDINSRTWHTVNNKTGVMGALIACTNAYAPFPVYYFDGAWYSEDKALRMIKLGAFI